MNNYKNGTLRVYKILGNNLPEKVIYMCICVCTAFAWVKTLNSSHYYSGQDINEVDGLVHQNILHFIASPRFWSRLEESLLVSSHSLYALYTRGSFISVVFVIRTKRFILSSGKGKPSWARFRIHNLVFVLRHNCRSLLKDFKFIFLISWAECGSSFEVSQVSHLQLKAYFLPLIIPILPRSDYTLKLIVRCK